MFAEPPMEPTYNFDKHVEKLGPGVYSASNRNEYQTQKINVSGA
jgi:hypothetical protein